MEIEKEYLGIKRENIPELTPKYLEGLNERQKQDIIRRWRCVKDFEDGNAVGTVLLNNVSIKTHLDFREISRTYFGNTDGAALAGLVNIFLMIKNEENKKEIIASDGTKIGV